MRNRQYDLSLLRVLFIGRSGFMVATVQFFLVCMDFVNILTGWLVYGRSEKRQFKMECIDTSYFLRSAEIFEIKTAIYFVSIQNTPEGTRRLVAALSRKTRLIIPPGQSDKRVRLIIGCLPFCIPRPGIYEIRYFFEDAPYEIA